MDNQKSLTKSRNYGIDLLRMVSMFLVVILHVLKQGGVLAAVPRLSLRYETAWLLEIGAYCAVNCYAVISGYVGYGSKFRYSNIVLLWLRVLFYTVIISVIFAFISPAAYTPFQWITSALLPTLTKQYWYFSAYFLLFFFFPLFNAAVDRLPRKLLRNLLVILTVFCAVQGLLGKDPFVLLDGYSVLWLGILYLVGAYMKKYDPLRSLSGKRALLLYAACVIVNWGYHWAAELIGKRIPLLTAYCDAMVSYTSIPVFLSAVFLLHAFSRLKIGKGWQKLIVFFSPLAFSVYLIHVQPLVWTRVMGGRFASFANLSSPLLALAVVGTAIGIYLVCSLADWIREFLFTKLKLKEKLISLEEKCKAKFESAE